jgi:TRIAP1/MDM35 family protein
MASSLSPQCTPLKHAYDQCFNSWFEGYLQPATQESSSNSSSGVSSSTSRKAGNGISQNSTSKEEARRAYSKRKAEEFEEKCGKVWKSYRTCIAVSLSSRLSSFFPLILLKPKLSNTYPHRKQ